MSKHPTLLPWPDELGKDRMWSDGTEAAWAFDDGSWIALRPGMPPCEYLERFEVASGDALDGEHGWSDDNCRAARAAADAALAEYLAGVGRG